MADRNAANLRNIATLGFDQPLSLNSLNLSDHPDPSPGSQGSGETSGAPTTSRMDHPKLTASGIHFLKGVDLSVPALAAELGFAEALAVRNNPTTVDNIHGKLTVMPPNYHSFTKDQQEAFCKLVDFAEMKQALRLELKAKEKMIREQEIKYLTTDYGLGNVVHGWDITNPAGPGTGTDRTGSSNRLIARRKVKDSDRIFSSSSVMSFMTSSRMSRAKRLDSVKKKKRNRENAEKERKKQQHSLQRRRLNAFREENSADTEESFAGDENYAMSGRDSDADDEEVIAKKVSHKKKPVTGKKPKKPSDSFGGAGKVSQVARMTKLIPTKPDKPASETGHRLRTLLTNKTPHSATTSLFPPHHHHALIPTESGVAPPAPKEPIKIKFVKTRLFETAVANAGANIPPSPASSTVTVDSGSEAPDTPGALSKRNRGRPKRLDA